MVQGRENEHFFLSILHPHKPFPSLPTVATCHQSQGWGDGGLAPLHDVLHICTAAGTSAWYLAHLHSSWHPARHPAHLHSGWHHCMTSGTFAQWLAPLHDIWHICTSVGASVQQLAHLHGIWHLCRLPGTFSWHLAPLHSTWQLLHGSWHLCSGAGTSHASCCTPLVQPLSPSLEHCTLHKPSAFPLPECYFLVTVTLMAAGRAARAVPAPGLALSWRCHHAVTSVGSPCCRSAAPRAR